MWFSIIAILVMLGFFITLISIFAVDIAIVTINLTIIALIYYTNINEIKKKPNTYLKSAMIALIFVITLGQYIPLWTITTLAIFTNIVSAFYKVATNK